MFEKMSHTNYVILYLNKVEKEKQNISKASRTKKIVKNRNQWNRKHEKRENEWSQKLVLWKKKTKELTIH